MESYEQCIECVESEAQICTVGKQLLRVEADRFGRKPVPVDIRLDSHGRAKSGPRPPTSYLRTMSHARDILDI